MTVEILKVGAGNIDSRRLVGEIRKSVEEKMKDGAYTDTRVARAERTNLANLQSEDSFLPFYLDCLKDAVFVDISDFDIIERRRGMGALLVPLKRAIWKLLKFYTYRLWSQQNQVNGLLFSVLDSMENKYRARIEAMEKRIADLESK